MMYGMRLSEVGCVPRYIMTGNAFHNLFAPEYKAAYPEASVIGPEGLHERVAWRADKGAWLSALTLW